MKNVRCVITTIGLISVVALGGCSNLTPTQRNTLGGAAIGTAVGAGVAGVTGGKIGTGALVGAAAGAIGGALMSDE